MNQMEIKATALILKICKNKYFTDLEKEEIVEKILNSIPEKIRRVEVPIPCDKEHYPINTFLSPPAHFPFSPPSTVGEPKNGEFFCFQL